MNLNLQLILHVVIVCITHNAKIWRAIDVNGQNAFKIDTTASIHLSTHAGIEPWKTHKIEDFLFFCSFLYHNKNQ